MHFTGVVRLGLLSLGTAAILGFAVLLADGGLSGSPTTVRAASQAPRELAVLVGFGQDTVATLAYFPDTLRIRAGDMVTWRINGDTPHTVSFTTGTVPAGATRGNAFGPPGEVITSANVPVPEGPQGLQMRHPLELFPTRAPGAPVETYSGTGYVNSGRLYTNAPVPGVLGFETFSLIFDTPGLYRYVCLIHPEGMGGTVEVLPASATDVPDQAAIDAQAQTEISAILTLTERARAAGSTARSVPGLNDTSLRFVWAGNSRRQAEDFRVNLDEFLPRDLTVTSGDTIIWEAITPHTVTFIPAPPAPEWSPLAFGPDGTPRLLSLPETVSPARPSAVYDPGQLFSSGNINPANANGSSFVLTFERPGTFEYFCLIHRERGMIGTVTVVPS